MVHSCLEGGPKATEIEGKGLQRASVLSCSICPGWARRPAVGEAPTLRLLLRTPSWVSFSLRAPCCLNFGGFFFLLFPQEVPFCKMPRSSFLRSFFLPVCSLELVNSQIFVLGQVFPKSYRLPLHWGTWTICLFIFPTPLHSLLFAYRPSAMSTCSSSSLSPRHVESAVGSPAPIPRHILCPIFLPWQVLPSLRVSAELSLHLESYS